MPEPLAELFSSRVRAAVLALVLLRPHLRIFTDRSLAASRAAGEQPAARVLQANPAWSAARRAGGERPPLPSRRGVAAVGAADGTDRAGHAARGSTTRRGRRSAGHRRLPGSAAISDPLRLLCTWSLWAVSGVEELDGVFDRCQVALVPIAGPSRIELAYLRPADWQARLTSKDPFTASLLEGPRIEFRAIAPEDRKDPDVA